MVKMITGHQKTILIISALMATSAHSDDCYDAYEMAYEAYTHASNGYKSISLKDAQEHAAKAHKELNNVMSTADECGCDDAVKTAGTAYRFASAAYESNDYEVAIGYLEESADSARKTMSNAIDCSGY